MPRPMRMKRGSLISSLWIAWMVTFLRRNSDFAIASAISEKCIGSFLASRTTKILSRILRGFTVGHFARPQKPFSVAKSLEIEAMARIWSGCS